MCIHLNQLHLTKLPPCSVDNKNAAIFASLEQTLCFIGHPFSCQVSILKCISTLWTPIYSIRTISWFMHLKLHISLKKLSKFLWKQFIPVSLITMFRSFALCLTMVSRALTFCPAFMGDFTLIRTSSKQGIVNLESCCWTKSTANVIFHIHEVVKEIVAFGVLLSYTHLRAVLCAKCSKHCSMDFKETQLWVVVEELKQVNLWKEM